MAGTGNKTRIPSHLNILKFSAWQRDQSDLLYTRIKLIVNTRLYACHHQLFSPLSQRRVQMRDIAFGVTNLLVSEVRVVFPVEDKVTATCLLALMIEP